MAFFKFRLPGQQTAEAQGNFSNPPTESVEVMRRRARHRLIGATVLVLVGVVGFPIVFDTQPRPVSADITIDIPERAKAVASGATTPAPQPLQNASALDPKEEVVPKSDQDHTRASSHASSSAPASATTASSTTASPTTAAVVPAATAPSAQVSGADAAKSDDKDGAARFVVQLGAFAEDAKVRELRAKVEKAGLKTYTQEAMTKEGKRIRVRVGPFATRDEAEKAAAKLKPLNLQPQILSL